jgi:hypothetical protein
MKRCVTSQCLCLAKIPSGRKRDLIFEFGSNLGRDFQSGKGGAEWVAKDREAPLSRRLPSTLGREVRSCDSASLIIAMMQAAKPWHGYNAAASIVSPHCFPTRRCSFIQPEMRPVVVIITDVLFHEPPQMPFI